MIGNSLVLVSFIALLSVNTIDAIMTRVALSKRGFEERMSLTRKMIEELGLRRAMLVKSLLPLPFVIVVVLCWNNALCGYVVSLVFMSLVIWLSCVVAHNCIELWKNHR